MPNRNVQFYEGWKVLFGVFLCALLAAGSTTYTFALFVLPVTEEFGISRANVNLGFTAFLIGFGLFAPLTGILIDRFSARLIMIVGGLLFGTGLFVISRSDSLVIILIIILGPISFAMNASGTLAATTVVSRWFKRRRGKALGIVALSTSTGGFIFIPVTAYLIENSGWRDALMQVGIIVMVGTILMALFVVKARPSGNEDGYDNEFSSARSPEEKPLADQVVSIKRTWTPKELFRNRNFWLLALGIGLLYGSDMAMVTSQIPHFLDHGIELSEAALIGSFLTMSAIGGKMLVGALADKIDLRIIFHMIAIAHMLLLVVYVVMPPYMMLLVLATILGIGIGGVFPIWATMIAWLFGHNSYGLVMGIMTVLMNLIGVVALRFIGQVYDQNGDYLTAFSVFFIAVIVSMALIASVRPQADPK